MSRFARDGGVSYYRRGYQPSTKTLIREKLKVLQEFYIVDCNNIEEIQKYLEQAIESHPNSDPQVALDQAASVLIKKKFREI
jgi:hypothetical protein